MNFDRVLIVAAHPDDDILGCGGILSKFRGQTEFSVLFYAKALLADLKMLTLLRHSNPF